MLAQVIDTVAVVNRTVRLDLVHRAQAVLDNHQRHLVAVVDLLQVVEQAHGVDRPTPIALLEILVAGATKDVALLQQHRVGRGRGAHIVAKAVEVDLAGGQRGGVLGRDLHVHAFAAPQAACPRRIRATDLNVAAVEVHLALLLLCRQDVGRIARVRVAGVAGDHAADLVLRIDLMTQGDTLGARQELMVQGIETRLRVVPVAVAKGHGRVSCLGHHTAAHHAAKAAHEQAIDLVKGEPVAHQALVLGHDSAGVVEIEIDELGVLPAAVVFGQAIGQLVVAEGDHGLDALLLTGLEHAAVELDAGLVGLGLVAVGEDTAPVDGHAVALKAHLAKKLDIVEVVMVHVHGLVAGIVVLGQNAVGNVARLGDRAAGHDVGNTEALAVLVVSAFALIGGSGAAPQKSIGKSHVGSFRTCWEGSTDAGAASAG